MPEMMPGTLAEALAALQGQLPRVAKDQTASVTSQRTGKTHTYRYAGLLDVTEALMPLLSKLGLSFVAMPTLIEQGFVLNYILKHVGGDQAEGFYPLPTSGSPQEIGTAITYARRYALCAVTGLAPGGDDDDGRAAEQAHKDALKAADSQPVPRTGTNAELRATGQMDRKQKAAHDKLEADTLRNQGHAERSHPRAPDPDDPWAQDAPVDGQRAAAMRESLSGPSLTDPEDKPGSRLESQHRMIERLLGLLGITVEKRAEQHDYVATLIGAEVLASFNDLSFTQAADAIRLLQAELAKEKAHA